MGESLDFLLKIGTVIIGEDMSAYVADIREEHKYKWRRI